MTWTDQMTFIHKCIGLAGVLLAIAHGVQAEVDDQSDVVPVTGVDTKAIFQAPLVVKPVIELSGSQNNVTLGDLVSSQTMSATARSAFNAVRLADAPQAGEIRTFTEAGLADVFRPVLSAIEAKTGESFLLRVPSRVTVGKKKISVSRAEVERELRSGLKAICGDCEFEISGLNAPLISLKSSAGVESWSLRLRSELPKGSFSIPLEVVETGGERRRYWVSGQVAIRRNVPVASRAVSIGERLQSEDFTFQMKDVTFASDTPASEAELKSNLAGRQIPAGQVIWRSHLRKEMAVQTGELVKVAASGEGWVISLDGVAMGSGYVGDVVRVKIPRTQKVVSGLLTEKGLVEVR